MSPTTGKLSSLEAAVLHRSRWAEQGKRVALANGVFDLLHVGHVRYLEGAKALADILIVAVNSDASTRAYKGPTRPVIPQDERAELVAALACTDLVIVFDEPDVRALIRALRPDVQVKGTDYTPETIPEADEVLAYGGQVAVAGDPKNHSTTALAKRLAPSAPPPTPSGEVRMPLSALIKDVLACPQCRGSLEFHEEQSEIHCLSCGLAYPVREGIPEMLRESARALSSSS